MYDKYGVLLKKSAEVFKRLQNFLEKNFWIWECKKLYRDSDDYTECINDMFPYTNVIEDTVKVNLRFKPYFPM